MPCVLKLLLLDEKARQYYQHHSSFHPGDAGLDLFAIEDQTIKAGDTAIIKLGIKAAAYDHDGTNVSWLILPRSSISKTPLRVSNSLGLIDAGYRGELMCCVDNIKQYDYEVKAGDRLVQAVFFHGKQFTLEITDQLNETSRGSGGWGSTGTTVGETTKTKKRKIADGDGLEQVQGLPEKESLDLADANKSKEPVPKEGSEEEHCPVNENVCAV